MQSLVKAGWLKFKKTEEDYNVNKNPLPNHEGPAINVVDTFTERYKNKVCDVTTSICHQGLAMMRGRSLDASTRSSVYSTPR